VIYRLIFDWMFGFIVPYTFTQLGTTGSYNTIAILHPFEFIVAHTLGFLAFTSRILATDLSLSQLALEIIPEVFFSQPNPFLTLILQMSVAKSRLNSIPSSYHGRLASWNSTVHFRLLFFTPTILSLRFNNLLCPFIIPRHASHGKHSPYY
jgi:hypothetical protein